jgi:FtsZ-binding cell division protein ZapB
MDKEQIDRLKQLELSCLSVCNTVLLLVVEVEALRVAISQAKPEFSESEEYRADLQQRLERVMRP